MDTVTYPDLRVAQFIQGHFVAARVMVKQDPRLVQEYLVSWTPHVVIADDQGKVHYRIEGYLPPEDFELKPLPSFPVDVQRRWPSVEKARRVLGWESQIDVRDGVAQTVDWLREHAAVEA